MAQYNDHDLIVQFAKGTEALNALKDLSELAVQRDKELAVALSGYETLRQDIIRRYSGHMSGVIHSAMRRIDDLAPAEIKSDSDYEDD